MYLCYKGKPLMHNVGKDHARYAIMLSWLWVLLNLKAIKNSELYHHILSGYIETKYSWEFQLCKCPVSAWEVLNSETGCIIDDAYVAWTRTVTSLQLMVRYIDVAS